MTTSRFKNRGNRAGPWRFCAGLALLATSSAGHADSKFRDWEVSRSFSLTATTAVVYSAGRSGAMNWLAATASAKLEMPDKPCDGGVFAGYQVAGNSDLDGIRSVGAWASCGRRRWNATSWFMAAHKRETATLWYRGAGLRYDLTDRDQLVLDAMLPSADPGALRMALGYSRQLSRRTRLDLSLGTDRHGTVDLTANLEFRWSVI
jgi:hypothetical protein